MNDILEVDDCWFTLNSSWIWIDSRRWPHHSWSGHSRRQGAIPTPRRIIIPTPRRKYHPRDINNISIVKRILFYFAHWLSIFIFPCIDTTQSHRRTNTQTKQSPSYKTSSISHQLFFDISYVPFLPIGLRVENSHNFALCPLILPPVLPQVWFCFELPYFSNFYCVE